MDILLPTTPVKDQGRTDMCWAYAMLAAIETDRIAMGDSVNLSPLWLERKELEEQADNTYLTGDNISLRNMLPEALRLMQCYGMVAWDAYHPDTPASSRVMSRKVMQLAKACNGQQRGIASFRTKLTDILDTDLGPAPRFVFMLGCEYTPLEFAHSVCMPGDWRAYTSFIHHPFYRPFAIEVPDNRQHHEAMNIPIHILYNKVVNSLRHHHPVAWEGCMNLGSNALKNSTRDSEENLKSGQKGLTNNNSELQKQRQRLFERHILTDDHCMTIIGMGHTRDGQPLFICKNSWGIGDGNHGLRYMSARQFMLSTIMIMARE